VITVIAVNRAFQAGEHQPTWPVVSQS